MSDKSDKSRSSRIGSTIGTGTTSKISQKNTDKRRRSSIYNQSSISPSASSTGTPRSKIDNSARSTSVSVSRRIGSYNKNRNRIKQSINYPPFRFVLPKPDCIVMDLLGTLVAKKFMSTSKEFHSFVKKNLTSYLNDNWRKKPLRVIMNFFRGSQNVCPSDIRLRERSETTEDQIAQAKRHILYRMKMEPESPAVAIFMLGITEWGYSQKLIVTPVYDEIHDTLKTWSEVYKLPIYVAVGSADFLIMVLTSTTDGNLIPYFKGHMNLMDFDGNKVSKDFKKLITLVRSQPNKILYITRFRSDARKAIENGIVPMVVLREDFDDTNLIPTVHKWRLKNPNATTINKPTIPKEPVKTVLPKAPKEKSFISKLGSAFGLEALIGGGPSAEVQRNILLDITKELDTNKLRTYAAEQSLHQRSSQILEEDLDYYRVILSLNELDFT